MPWPKSKQSKTLLDACPSLQSTAAVKSIKNSDTNGMSVCIIQWWPVLQSTVWLHFFTFDCWYLFRISPEPPSLLPQIWARWWESPGALSFGNSGQFRHVWKPLPWPYPLTTIKKPQDHLLSLSLESFVDQLGKPTLLSPESIIMWMINIFISSWHVCGIISFDMETVFWVGSILYLYSG